MPGIDRTTAGTLNVENESKEEGNVYRPRQEDATLAHRLENGLMVRGLAVTNDRSMKGKMIFIVVGAIQTRPTLNTNNHNCLHSLKSFEQ